MQVSERCERLSERRSGPVVITIFQDVPNHCLCRENHVALHPDPMGVYFYTNIDRTQRFQNDRNFTCYGFDIFQCGPIAPNNCCVSRVKFWEAPEQTTSDRVEDQNFSVVVVVIVFVIIGVLVASVIVIRRKFRKRDSAGTDNERRTRNTNIHNHERHQGYNNNVDNHEYHNNNVDNQEGHNNDGYVDFSIIDGAHYDRRSGPNAIYYAGADAEADAEICYESSSVGYETPAKNVEDYLNPYVHLQEGLGNDQTNDRYLVGGVASIES